MLKDDGGGTGRLPMISGQAPFLAVEVMMVLCVVFVLCCRVVIVVDFWMVFIFLFLPHSILKPQPDREGGKML